MQIREIQEENTALHNELKQRPSKSVGALVGTLAPDSQRRAPPVEHSAISTQETKNYTTVCQGGTERTKTAALGVWDRQEPLVIVVLQSVGTIQVPPRLTPRSFHLPAALAQPEPVREHSWRRLRTLHTRPNPSCSPAWLVLFAPWRDLSAALVMGGPLWRG